MEFLTEHISTVGAFPPSILWTLVVSVALLLPLLPLSIIRYLNVRDTRAEQIERRFTIPSGEIRAAERVILLTVAGWPSMPGVVYEDASTGPTDAGFEFKAATIAYDIAGALGSRGIEVRTMELVEVETMAELEQADLAVVVYPARHNQLPWQLLAFFDRLIEPAVAAHQPGLGGMPLATIALGDTETDIQSSQQHVQRMQERYGLILVGNAGLVNGPDRLMLYEQALDFAEDVLLKQSEMQPHGEGEG